MKVIEIPNKLKILYAIAILLSVLLIAFFGPIEYYDTASYLKAWDDCISHGVIDIFRTPVYPTILGISKWILPNGYTWFVIIFQHIIFLVSIYSFWCVSKCILKSEKLSFLISLLYVFIPAITAHNNWLLTEPLAFSGTVFLIHTTLSAVYKQSKPAFACFAFLCIFLLMLRPAFIYILPVFIVWGCYLFFFHISTKKTSLSIITSSLVISGFLCLYMLSFKQHYGVFAISSVSTYNQLYIGRQYGLFEPERITDSTFRQELETSYKQFGKQCLNDSVLCSGWMSPQPLTYMHQIVQDSHKYNRINWIMRCYGRTFAAVSGNDSIVPALNYNIERTMKIIGLNLSTLFLFTIIYLLLLLQAIVRGRRVSKSLLLFMLTASNVIVVIWGAQNDWHRLLLPSMSLYLLMFGQICTCIRYQSPNSLTDSN